MTGAGTSAYTFPSGFFPTFFLKKKQGDRKADASTLLVTVRRKSTWYWKSVGGWENKPSRRSLSVETEPTSGDSDDASGQTIGTETAPFTPHHILSLSQVNHTRMIGALTPRQQLGNAPVHRLSSWFLMSASTFSSESNRQRYSTIVENAISGSVKLGSTIISIHGRAIYILRMGEVSPNNCSEAQI